MHARINAPCAPALAASLWFIPLAAGQPSDDAALDFAAVQPLNFALAPVPVTAVNLAALVQDEPALPEAGNEKAAEEKEWKSHFDLAGNGSWGNTDTQSARLAITSVREKPTSITKLDAAYYVALTDGDKSENRFTAGVLQDWLIANSRWFYFADARYDFDEFQSWDHRFAAHAGVGYRFIDNDDFKWKARAGVGVVKEWGSDNDDWRPEAVIGTDILWKITDKQTLEASTTLYPDLEDLGEFRWVNSANWSVLLDEQANMSLTAGINHEYQSKVDPGREKNDVKAFVGLRFDF